MGPIATITGVGLVTPLGASSRATWNALLDGESIRDHSRAVGSTAGPGRLHDLAGRAALEAIEHAGWSVPGADTALIFGTSKGPIESWLSTADPTSDNPAAGRASLKSLSFGLADSATELTSRLGLTGPRMTISAACASGLHALARAAWMIQSGQVSRAIVVAAEASVHPMFVGSFRRLGVLPPEGEVCRPFDRNRTGFLMSEAAAAVCLEPFDAERSRERNTVGVEAFALGGDATHLTGSDPAGDTLRRLLAEVIAGRPIDLIHGHGTGTVQNDPIELAALESVLPESSDPDRPYLYSHKGALGHSLGASGLVSIALNWMMHTQGVVPPNVNTADSLPAERINLCPTHSKKLVRRSIAIGAGFGGPMAVVGLVGGEE